MRVRSFFASDDPRNIETARMIYEQSHQMYGIKRKGTVLQYSSYPERFFIIIFSSLRILKTKKTGENIKGIRAHQDPRAIGVKRNINRTPKYMG